MRVMVVGTSGAGKSTFAARLADAAGLRYVELDLLNWGPNWYNRTAEEPEAFIQSVDEATQGDDWVVAGGYSKTWPIIWSRAEHIVWLDLPRMLVMRQVIWRSLKRAFWDPEVFPGCHEGPTRLLRYDHPIRWAWRNYRSRREGIAEKLRDPAYAHLTVHQCHSRAEADVALARLSKR
jgi:adenylate kinase family enzyme